MTLYINDESFGLEHLIANGDSFTGVVPQKEHASDFTILGGTQDDVSPVVLPNRATYSVNRPDSTGAARTSGGTAQGGNGLFDPYLLFASSLAGKHVWVTGIHVIDPSGALEWTLRVTSGLDDGTAGTFVDDINNDAEILAGTGPTYERIGLELSPNKRIRFVSANTAGVGGARVTLLFTVVCGGYGRLY